MSTDDLVEERLRRSFLAHEADLTPAPDLAAVTVGLGRRAVRRRRRVALAGAVAAVACAAIGIAATLAPDSDDRGGPTPATHTTAPATILPGPWVTSLPLGDPPSAPYVGGTTLYLPGREVHLDGYDDASMIGNTVVGTIVIAERSGKGDQFSTNYLLVSPDGETTNLGSSTYHQALGAVVSPDGRYLARDDTVVDLTDMSVVARLPVNARNLAAWTDKGIVYWDAGARMSYVWRPGVAPVKLREDAGIVPPGLTVSPDGRWRVSRRLQATDTRTGESTWLAGAPLTGSAPTWSGTLWEDNDHLLVSVTQDGVPSGEYGVANGTEVAFLARCDVAAGSCERISDAVPVTSRLTIELSPY